MCCHSACHVRRLARRLPTSSDASDGIVIIVDLSLSMQEAKDPLGLRVRSLAWGRFCSLSQRIFNRLCGPGSIALRCLFLLCPLLRERLQVTDQRQLCWRLAFSLMRLGTRSALF